MTELQWLTTQPNPHDRSHAVDEGQRGWRIHAVVAPATATCAQLRNARALCGLWPARGWGVDMFIDEPCLSCVRAAERRGIAVPELVTDMVRDRLRMRERIRAAGVQS